MLPVPDVPSKSIPAPVRSVDGADDWRRFIELVLALSVLPFTGYARVARESVVLMLPVPDVLCRSTPAPVRVCVEFCVELVVCACALTAAAPMSRAVDTSTVFIRRFVTSVNGDTR